MHAKISVVRNSTSTIVPNTFPKPFKIRRAAEPEGCVFLSARMLFLHFIAKRARIFLQKAGTIYHFIFHRYIISYVSISLETKYEYMWGRS